MRKPKTRKADEPSAADKAIRRGLQMELCDEDAALIEAVAVHVLQPSALNLKRRNSMFIQIRLYEVKSGDPQQICMKTKNEFLPLLRDLPGFVDYMVANGQNGKVFSISFFQDKASLDEAYERAREWTVSNFKDQIPESPEVIEGELVHEGNEARVAGKAAA